MCGEYIQYELVTVPLMVVTVPETRIFRYNKNSRKIRASRFYKFVATPTGALRQLYGGLTGALRAGI